MSHLIILHDHKYTLSYLGQEPLKKVMVCSKNACLDRRTGDRVRQAQ